MKDWKIVPLQGVISSTDTQPKKHPGSMEGQEENEAEHMAVGLQSTHGC